ncbi:MAG: HI0074 family nucleotidyltransferase substrate-binding subunit [Chitinispirillaceae bacterium]
MTIDFSPLQKALAQFNKSLSFYHSELALDNEDLKEQFRAAVIQAFQYTYELGIKMIKRQLAQIVANPSELKEMNFMDLIRLAQESGIVKESLPFKAYREMRNITSHTYDEEKAEAILSITDDFQQDMQYVLSELERRNN